MAEQGVVKQDMDKMAEQIGVASGTAPDPFIYLKDGSKVDIHKCKTRNIGSVLQLISKVMEDLGVRDTTGTLGVDLENPAFLLNVLAKASGNVLEVAGDLCSLNHEEIADLEIDDTLKILVQIIAVNKDFFLKNVMPLAQSALQENKPASSTD